jgi:hypothetical protein
VPQRLVSTTRRRYVARLDHATVGSTRFVSRAALSGASPNIGAKATGARVTLRATLTVINESTKTTPFAGAADHRYSGPRRGNFKGHECSECDVNSASSEGSGTESPSRTGHAQTVLSAREPSMGALGFGSAIAIGLLGDEPRGVSAVGVGFAYRAP